MAVSSIAEILGFKTEVDFKAAITEFESTVELTFKPLTDRLRQQVLSSEVQQLELHMTFVESWRDRVAKALMYATAFEQHGKSNYFLLAGGKNITSTDREAYQKSITCAATALCVYFEQLLKSIDSRVNQCKILLRNEVESSVNSRRFS
jgi:hypothetical protein